MTNSKLNLIKNSNHNNNNQQLYRPTHSASKVTQKIKYKKFSEKKYINYLQVLNFKKITYRYLSPCSTSKRDARVGVRTHPSKMFSLHYLFVCIKKIRFFLRSKAIFRGFTSVPYFWHVGFIAKVCKLQD